MILLEIIIRNGIELSDLIEVMTSVAITTIVTITTIALPLILSEMQKLVERYKTNYVMNIFNSDCSIKLFWVVLTFSIILAIGWVIIFFFNVSDFIYCVSIILCVQTLLLLISLIVLVLRIIHYTMPNKFLKVIFDKIDKQRAPKFYFKQEIYRFSQDKKEEKRRMKKYNKIQKFDKDSTFLFIVLARIYVSTDEEAIKTEIREYWDTICRRASLQKDEFNYYTNSYYNFIRELEKWAIEKDDKNLQIEAIKFSQILLNAHLPKPRKMGEPEPIEDERRRFSYETLKSLWTTLRLCVDNGGEVMFQKYWQVVNNLSSRKYESIHNQNQKDFTIDKIRFDIMHYAGASYLIASEKNTLLEYILEYSQSYPFHWQIIPEKVNDIIKMYVFTKRTYEEIQYEMDFTFSDDYNLYDKKKTCYPMEQFTVLLLLCKWNEKESIQINLEKKEEQYIKTLISVMELYPRGMNWHTFLNLESQLKYKANIITHLKQLVHETSTTVSLKTPSCKPLDSGHLWLKFQLILKCLLNKLISGLMKE